MITFRVSSSSRSKRLSRLFVFLLVVSATALLARGVQAADGGLDGTFNAGESGTDTEVVCLAVQPDGKILIGGSFTTYNGDSTGAHFLMRLNADGTRDVTFNS